LLYLYYNISTSKQITAPPRRPGTAYHYPANLGGGFFTKGNKMSEKITMKVAIYEYLPTGDCSCLAGLRLATDHDRKDSNVMRVSEWQTVEFTTIPMEEILPEMVKNINEKIELIKSEAMQEVSLLEGKKAELLALN